MMKNEKITTQNNMYTRQTEAFSPLSKLSLPLYICLLRSEFRLDSVSRDTS